MTDMEKLQDGARKLGLQLTPRQVEQFQTYYQELIDWNRRMNLTAITDYEEVQIKHFLDSLTVTLALTQPCQGLRVIDVGAGAGLPGIPIKIAMPDTKLVLLEATAKKTAFLHHIKRRLELDDIEVIAGRAEVVAHSPQHRERFDIVLCRGVAPLPTQAELTLPFCTVGGSSLAQKKGNIDAEMNQAAKAIKLLGGEIREVKKIGLEEFAGERWLIIVDKVAPTPPQYPRRPGIPAKRPIV